VAAATTVRASCIGVTSHRGKAVSLKLPIASFWSEVVLADRRPKDKSPNGNSRVFLRRGDHVGAASSEIGFVIPPQLRIGLRELSPVASLCEGPSISGRNFTPLMIGGVRVSDLPVSSLVICLLPFERSGHAAASQLNRPMDTRRQMASALTLA
jgi:hypothetical protein